VSSLFLVCRFTHYGVYLVHYIVDILYTAVLEYLFRFILLTNSYPWLNIVWEICDQMLKYRQSNYALYNLKKWILLTIPLPHRQLELPVPSSTPCRPSHRLSPLQAPALTCSSSDPRRSSCLLRPAAAAAVSVAFPNLPSMAHFLSQFLFVVRFFVWISRFLMLLVWSTCSNICALVDLLASYAWCLDLLTSSAIR
jgi:hypothetical protein